MSCLSRNEAAVEGLSELDPLDLADAANAIRRFFEADGFREVVLSPIDTHVVNHPAAFPPLEVGQLRFNTEPEVWSAWDGRTPFFSISYLFRRESAYNLLRRPVFQVVDFYQESQNDALIARFGRLLRHLALNNVISALHELPIVDTRYNNSIDGPEISMITNPCLALAKGYQPEESFFEIDEQGHSTREELFLVSSQGFLEIAGMGCVGRNSNPLYKMTGDAENIRPPRTLSGLGFGLERLLMCDQVVAQRGRDDQDNREGRRASG